ncbi:MAG: glycosyltransferase N-terminal domain-containing protein [Prevotella sp.]|nr:glycosyltransferase N-terminal domain-containing protein [Prevotella sp.]
MYNIAIYLYLTGVAISSLFDKKVKKMWQGERQAVDTLRREVDPTAKYIWFHAASLGEFEQGRPIIERIKAKHPEYKILLTFFSPSGYEVRKDYKQADIVCYLPLDTIRNARRFLRAVRPVMAFFIKYEFWYNYLHILKHRGVPVYSVSSIFRPKQVFFKWYGKSYAKVLRCITEYFVQNDESRRLLHSIGIGNATVIGDTRFDRVLAIKEQSKALPLIEAFKGMGRNGGGKSCNIFIAGSSWPPDEDIFIKFFNDHEDWKLIIAPHVISEEHLADIQSKLGTKALRYTQATEETAAKARCMIIDCFGLLSTIYRYGEIAYVGGGFGVGIHNVPEAAVWGVPVIFGPNNKRFQEAQDLLACGGSFEISSYDDFDTLATRLMQDADYRHKCGEASAEYVRGRAGATERIMESVNL